MKLFVPLAIQVVVDDVGWWSGENGTLTSNAPYRTGINRRHVPADYSAIVELGKQLNIRPQAAMILCEWDRENILRELPTSTWMGENWDNSKNIGTWIEEASDIINNGKDNFELTLHGVGHEYWEDGMMTRAEWFNRDAKMRPEEEIRKHIDYYNKLLKMNNLGNFPVSFVPSAFLYMFDDGENRLASILSEFGIKYISTPFSVFKDIYKIEIDPEYKDFKIESGIITADRRKDLFSWQVLSPNPQKEINGTFCGMHWPNILHENPEQNMEVVDRWVNYLKQYESKPETMLAPESSVAFSQLVYNAWLGVNEENNIISFDFTKIDSYKITGLNRYFYIKTNSETTPILANPNLTISLEKTDGKIKTYKICR